MITVLVLASSPLDQGPLHLGKEHKIIKHSLDSTTNRDQFRIIQCMATTVDDLRRYLLEYDPSVVHFCGHGGGQKGLCFEDDSGNTHTVSGEQLAKLFHLVNESVKCVVLNACYSEVQAKAISQHIDFVVGMKEEIGDQAAIKFAQGFYEAVWTGRSYEKAFKFGCSAIDTANIPEEHVPVILTSPRLGGMKLEYSEDTQTIENFILRYLNTDHSERSKLTTQGEAIRQTIIDHADLKTRRVFSSVSVVSTQTIAEEYKEVYAIIRSGLHAFDYTFYLKQQGDSFLLDWEATMGWWPIPLTTFKALGTNKALCVRVLAQLCDYYNYDFDSSNSVSILLSHIKGGHINGYIHRRASDCLELVKHLYDGKEHRIILEILPSSKSNRHVHITQFVSDSWIMPDEKPLYPYDTTA